MKYDRLEINKKTRKVSQYLNTKISKLNTIILVNLSLEYTIYIQNITILSVSLNRCSYKALLKRVRLGKLLMYHGREFHNRTPAARNDCLDGDEKLRISYNSTAVKYCRLV